MMLPHFNICQVRLRLNLGEIFGSRGNRASVTGASVTMPLSTVVLLPVTSLLVNVVFGPFPMPPPSFLALLP
jgi:hypothetical protein